MSAWLQRTNRMISAQLAAYRQELGGSGRDREARVPLRCPRCGLTLTPRLVSLQPRHCPRCLARRTAVVGLQPLADGDPGSAPGGPGLRARD